MNATTVLNLGALSFNVSGAPLTCFPKTGTIISCAQLSEDMSFTEGLNGCSALVISPGTGYDLTVNVLAFSPDHTLMDGWRTVFLSGKPLTVVASYGASKWVSGAVGIVGNPVVNINADGAEFVPYILRGSYTIASIGKLIAPAPATIADLPS